MERAENLARILDVNETFARGGSEEESWLPIVRLLAEEEAFFKTNDKARANAVVSFYTIERDNPSAVITSISNARENARTMRHIISTEMWMQLNIFDAWVKQLTAHDIRLENLSRVCAAIKEGCQTHAGILEGTLYRDQVWYFYQLGKQIERAGQTSRLVDIKSHLLENPVSNTENAIDISQWNALLRSAAGYHAFRRNYPRGIEPNAVMEFFFFDTGFPRSVAHCLGEIDMLLAGLARGGLTGARDVLAELAPLNDQMKAADVRVIHDRGLSPFIDDLQRELDEFTERLADRFFQ